MFNAEKFISDLGVLWKEVGYNDDQRKERTLKIRNEINSTLEKVFNSEREEKIQMEADVAKWAEEIVKISKRLGEPIPQYDLTGKTLLERIEIVQNVRTSLLEQKDTKETELKGLLNTLTMTIKAIGSNGLQNEKYKSLDNLSESHIQEIRTYANDMAKVRDDILTKSQSTISDIKRLSEEMSEPLSELTCSLDGSASVTAEQLSALTAEKKRLTLLKEQRAREIDACLSELRRISAEMGAPDPTEVESFAENVKILSSENVKRCQLEVTRQNESFKNHIKGEIREVIEELRAVWEDIGYERKTIDAHGANFDTKTVEGLKTLLGYYKSQLGLFVGLKELTDQIIELIENRNEILREWEYLSSDEMKSHLTGRSREDSKIRFDYMRSQAKLSKIPRIEGSLLDKLSEWKERTNTCFEYEGVDYFEKIQNDVILRKENPIYKNTKAVMPTVVKRRRSLKTPQKQKDTDPSMTSAKKLPKTPSATTTAAAAAASKKPFNATFTAPSQPQKDTQQKTAAAGGFVSTLATPGFRGGMPGKEPKTTGMRAGNKRPANLSEMPKQRLFGDNAGGKIVNKKKSIKRKSIRGLESHKPIKKSRRLK